jgi:Flp pilus assembly protein TadG
MAANPTKTLLSRFRRSEGGNAAVEFALIVPFLMTLYLGSLEASALFTADKRINSISATVGDLVAQWDPDDGYIDTTTLDGYFAAAKGLITPYTSVGVKQVLSMVFVKSDGTTKVLWSKANGTGATARTVSSSFTPLTASNTAMMNTITRGGCVIAAETTYSYKPLLGAVFTTTLTLAHTNYFIPRYGANDVIQVASPGITSTSCTTGS